MSGIYGDAGAILDEFREALLRPTDANGIVIRVEKSGPRFAPTDRVTVRWTSDEGVPHCLTFDIGEGSLGLHIGE